MLEVPVADLARAIRDLHGGEPTFVEAVPIEERYEDAAHHFTSITVWGGSVGVFDLAGHPTASRVYAWSAQVPGTDRRVFTAVLHEGKVDSPAAAVRATIVARYRANRGR